MWKWKSLSHVWLFATPWDIYSPWNSPGRSTGVGSHSLLQGSSQPRNRTGVSCTAGRLYTNWASRVVPMHGLIMHSINAILQVLIVFCLWPHPTQIHVLPSVLFYVLRGWLWPLSGTFSQVSWTTGFLFKSSRYQSIGGECGLYFPCSFSLWTLISGILPWLCNF